MTQCDVCVNGLGLLTIIRHGIVLTSECLYCGGVGYFCGRCENPVDECRCPASEDEE